VWCRATGLAFSCEVLSCNTILPFCLYPDTIFDKRKAANTCGGQDAECAQAI